MKALKKEKILRELKWSFSKSSGPGGQHVNTTDSKAQMSWDFQNSSSLSLREKRLVEQKLHNYLKKSNLFKLTGSTQRSREQNKKKCILKLFHLLEQKAFKKEKKRMSTKPTKSSIEKRIKAKKLKGDTKKNRKKVNF